MRFFGMLLLKLVLVPTVIAAVSLVGRRRGPGMSGLMVALPWTSGPVLLFLSLERGAPFAAEASVGIIGGVVSVVAFCMAYSWASLRTGWAWCVLLGVAAYLTATLLVLGARLPHAASFAVVAIVLVAGLRGMPRSAQDAEAGRRIVWDIPLRMVCATMIVVVLTGLAGALGPRLAGLLAPFPVYAGVLAVFAHRESGAGAALETLSGVIRGSFSFAVFFLVAGTGLQSLGIPAAFVAGSVSAVSLHMVLLESYRVAAVRASPGTS